ncbi:MAG: SH3 domain-containing protein [Leptospiraceae bacterium]|nr:SH3 domain-containing protein [Leptospiraceae bacterium]
MKFQYSYILSIYLSFIFLFSNDFIYSQSLPVNEVKQYRFVIAKTGLTLRLTPDTEADAVDTIPFGKVIEIVTELSESVNIQGNISNWFEVKYKWHKGYVASGYLSESSESPEKKIPKSKEYIGIWKGDWKCGKEFSHLKIKKNGYFSGWLFSGGDDSGCGGINIKGTWTQNALGEVCLKTNTEEPCFFLYNNKLIANLASGNGFKENYESEILSGLGKVK